jgi:hypothetical protein
MHAARAQPGEMPLADQQPGRPGLLLLRERTSQRIALLPGARAHCISVGRSAAQQRGCVSIPPQPRRRETRCSRGFIQSLRPRQRQCLRYCEAEGFRGLKLTTSSNFTVPPTQRKIASRRRFCRLGGTSPCRSFPARGGLSLDARPWLPGAAEVSSAPHHGGRCARPCRSSRCRLSAEDGRHGSINRTVGIRVVRLVSAVQNSAEECPAQQSPQPPAARMEAPPSPESPPEPVPATVAIAGPAP